MHQNILQFNSSMRKLPLWHVMMYCIRIYLQSVGESLNHCVCPIKDRCSLQRQIKIFFGKIILYHTCQHLHCGSQLKLWFHFVSGDKNKHLFSNLKTAYIGYEKIKTSFLCFWLNVQATVIHANSLTKQVEYKTGGIFVHRHYLS